MQGKRASGTYGKQELTAAFETVYTRYNRSEYLFPDPLSFVHDYRRPEDREIVAFLAALFALGRVQSIRGFLQGLFDSFPSPFRDLISGRGIRRWRANGPFLYRFFSREKIEGLLLGARGVLRHHGSLESAFLVGYGTSGQVWDGLAALWDSFGQKNPGIIPDPRKGSACKRLHLFLRWVVRKDELDLGLWTQVSPADLLYPVDTHILKISQGLGITRRKQGDRAAVDEITDFFKGINPDDPVKYDFSISRFGIHPDLEYAMLYRERAIADHIA